MPIYLDVSAAVHSKAGLGRYAASLTEALATRYPDRIALFYNRDHDLQPPMSLRALPARSVRAGYKPWRMAVWLGQLAGLGFDRLLPDAQLYHATEHLLMPLRGAPTVLTVHDLIYRLFPQHHKRLNYWFLNAAMPLFARRASAIIAISEATKRDLVSGYGLPANKIQVIYEAAAPHFRPPTAEQIAHVRQKYHLPERYMLHVGTIEPRKNLSRVLEALEQLRAQGRDLGLVIVGSKGWLYDDFFRQLESSPAREAVILPGYVVDEDLPAVYGAAALTIMASVYEGFGLPILEAMACGTPVVSSHSSSLPELGGEAARYFDPYHVDEMAEAIRQVLVDRELGEAMRQAGLAQAARFSWARAAEETMALYERIADHCPSV
jgi:glycosyltransferase involved in cell wall biosynthesis